MRLLPLIFALVSFGGMASVNRQPSPIEVKAMCLSVDKSFQEEVAEVSVRVDSCLKEKMVVTETPSGLVIAANIPVRSTRGNAQTLCKAILKEGKIATSAVRCANINL